MTNCDECIYQEIIQTSYSKINGCNAPLGIWQRCAYHGAMPIKQAIT